MMRRIRDWGFAAVAAAFLIFGSLVPAMGQVVSRGFQYDPKAQSDTNVQPQFAASFDSNAWREMASQPASECEVSVVKAEFERAAKLMLTSGVVARPEGQAKGAPSLELQLNNRSMKGIASVDIVARLKVKESVYQLDSVTRSLSFHLSNRPGSQGDREGAQRLQLAESVLGFESVAIQQVSYTDGSTWRPESAYACGYRSPAGSIRVAK